MATLAVMPFLLRACRTLAIGIVAIAANRLEMPSSQLVLVASSDASQNRWEEAARALAEVIAQDPANATARRDRAVALLHAELYDEALQHLEASLDILPRNVSLKHILARLLATCPDPELRDGLRALALAQEVLRQEPSYDHVETVGMALAELGRFEEAVDWQGQLLEQAKRSGRVALVPGIKKRLEAYQRGEPCRAPWLEKAISELGDEDL